MVFCGLAYLLGREALPGFHGYPLVGFGLVTLIIQPADYKGNYNPFTDC